VLALSTSCPWGAISRAPKRRTTTFEMASIPLLREAYTHIRKYFLSSKLFLEVVADPEAKDEEQLVVFIAANHDPDEASEALNRLDEDWWLDAMERAQDKLSITLEFQ
jgi:hypothetical protein